MLKKPCPYHKTPVNHTLEQCDMLKKYYSRAAAKEGEAKKDGGDGDVSGFPTVENVFLIFGGPTVDMSNSQRKRERHVVLAAEKAPPSFLDWSEDAIIFSREDHPNRIPNPGQYPLPLPLGVVEGHRAGDVEPPVRLPQRDRHATGAHCAAHLRLRRGDGVQLRAEEVDPEIAVHWDPQESLAHADERGRLRDCVRREVVQLHAVVEA
jgi:hypothetical protein